MRNYTLKQILTFIEVARDRSVSKAAARLFVTQPAVSMQLRQLEEAFGLALVEPSGRNIQLTQAGEEFLTHAIAAPIIECFFTSSYSSGVSLPFLLSI